MSLRLLRQTFHWHRFKLLLVVLAAAVWGFLIPVFYVAFGGMVGDLVERGVIPRELTRFGSGDLFTLPGSMTLSMQHPLFIAMIGVFAVGVSATAIAGERQRGTLEVLLARPISRVTLYATLGLALIVFLGLVLAALLFGMWLSAAVQGVANEIDLALLPVVYGNGLLLFGAFASFGLAASATFDRSGPAIGLTLAYVLIAYFVEVLGSLWPEARDYQDLSPFHHFQPAEILAGGLDVFDPVLLAGLVPVPIAWALAVFPRRDIAAPS
jgi:ABC-2 type transport system permease protein